MSVVCKCGEISRALHTSRLAKNYRGGAITVDVDGKAGIDHTAATVDIDVVELVVVAVVVVAVVTIDVVVGIVAGVDVRIVIDVAAKCSSMVG